MTRQSRIMSIIGLQKVQNKYWIFLTNFFHRTICSSLIHCITEQKIEIWHYTQLTISSNNQNTFSTVQLYWLKKTTIHKTAYFLPHACYYLYTISFFIYSFENVQASVNLTLQLTIKFSTSLLKIKYEYQKIDHITPLFYSFLTFLVNFNAETNTPTL